MEETTYGFRRHHLVGSRSLDHGFGRRILHKLVSLAAAGIGTVSLTDKSIISDDGRIKFNPHSFSMPCAPSADRTVARICARLLSAGIPNGSLKDTLVLGRREVL